MPFLKCISAGEASGAAAVNLLFGVANPSGKLAESFPLRIEDTPAYLNFPGNRDKVNYNEGIFIGYRYYDKKKMDILFPFGYGLSYTKFRYDNMKINGKSASENDFSFKDNDNVTVSVDITNIGEVEGAEIVQLYIENHIDEDNRPVKELRKFCQSKNLLPARQKRSHSLSDSEHGHIIMKQYTTGMHRQVIIRYLSEHHQEI